MFYSDYRNVNVIGRGLFIATLVSICLLVRQEVSATGGAFQSTKHGGGMTDGELPYNVGNGPGVDRSVNPDYVLHYNNDPSSEAGKYKGGECTHCHEPHASFGGDEPAPNVGGDAGPDAYLALKDYGSATNYSNLCWYCHQNFFNINGSGSPPTMGRWSFYQGQTVYQASSHYNDNNMYWPGDGSGSPIWPRKERTFLASGNRGSCVNCHTPHGIKAANAALAFDTTSPDGTGGVPASMQTIASGNPSVNADYLIPRQLIAWEETLCERCHDSSPAINIQAEINKRHLFGQSGHPIDDTTLAGRHVASESLPITTKHVECYDCHNPHAAKVPTGFLGDGDGGRVKGMKYIDINGVIQDPALGARQPYVYEVCLKCHGDSFDCIMPHIAYGAETLQAGCIDGTPRHRGHEYGRIGYNYQMGASNKRKEFDPTTIITVEHGGDGIQQNGAWHPVAVPGRNRSIQLCNQLKDAFGLTCVNAATAAIELGNLTINCTDCHNNNVTGTVTIRGPVTESNLRSTDKNSVYSGAEPVGPHGSTNKRILRANYNTRIGTSDSSFGQGASGPLNAMDSNFALCFLCHDSTPFKNKLDSPTCVDFTNGINNCLWTNFYGTSGIWGSSLHYYHLTTDLVDGIYIKCHECHNNVHSNVEAANTRYSGGAGQVFPPDGNTHLINFGPQALPDQYDKPAFYWDNVNEVFQCNLKCHTVNMTACSYKGETDGGPGGAGVCL